MARDGEQQAMTAERLAEIRERVDKWPRGYWLADEKHASLIQNGQNGGERHQIAVISCEHTATVDLLTHAYADETALLAEVERRRGREATLLEVVRAVANGIVMELNNSQTGEVVGDGLFLPLQEYLKAQARALLASAGEGSGGDGA